MSFLQSFTINTVKRHPFPFNIPAVQFAREVALGERVTIFVGDNGTGKSTRPPNSCNPTWNWTGGRKPQGVIGDVSESM